VTLPLEILAALISLTCDCVYYINVLLRRESPKPSYFIFKCCLTFCVAKHCWSVRVLFELQCALHKVRSKKKWSTKKFNTACPPNHTQHTYIHTYIHTYTHTHIHAYIHAYIHTYIHTYMLTYMHTYIHTFMHTHIHTYIHSFIHACIHYTNTYIMHT
jgi:hypothetical protein